MYSSYPGLILGFHGCDRGVGERIIRGDEDLRPSRNPYDWLGHGLYFWEFDPGRALQFAQERSERPLGASSIRDPFVVGAVIDLGRCLNLADQAGIDTLSRAWDFLNTTYAIAGESELPRNTPTDGFPLRRELDCTVVEVAAHIAETAGRRFDSVRAMFVEGEPLYPSAGFHAANHIQICVRNPNCIKGFFRPRQLDERFPRPNEG